jgi:RNA polymerase sigma factor (TIGR02999 family)
MSDPFPAHETAAIDSGDDSSSPLLQNVYEQLRSIARKRLAGEQPGHTLQATALVHEAYLKLSNNPSIFRLERARFMLAAAEAMRRILIDHARTKKRDKRGGKRVAGKREPLADVADLAQDFDPDETLALDEAICRLQDLDAQAAQVVKLRFFAGLSVEETAETIGISPRTVKRDWAFARAWLFDALK